MKPSLNQILSLLFFFLFVLTGAFAQKADTLENFDSGNIELLSYSNEDLEPDAWELNSEITYNNSPYALKLYGNTWKLQPIEPLAIDSSTVWQVSAFVQSVGEIQGFGLSDGTNTLRYAFAGTQEVNPEVWCPVYQGAFGNYQWIDFLLPVADDWLAQFGYLPEINAFVYINDRDNTSSGIVIFDQIMDVTSGLPIQPLVSVTYDKSVPQNKKSAELQFYAEVIDPDSNEHDFLWDFADGNTSSEQNPLHVFQASGTYTVLLKVTDETGKDGYASCKIDLGAGSGVFPVKLNFVGDIMLARKYEYPGGIIPTQGVNAIFEPTRSILGDAADITIANLECPLTTAWQHHPTKTIYFKGAPNNVSGISFAGIDIVTLANNHIIDYLTPGMLETQDVLHQEGIKHSGAGETAYEASRPLFVSKSGIQFALFAASDRHGQYNNYQPFLNAGYNKAGFYNLTEFNILKQIDEVKDVADFIVMEWHDGIEYSFAPSDDSALVFQDEGYHPFANRPSREDREIRQFAIDNGADLVICHHPHIMQAVEVYEGKLIAHSLGDFAFDLDYPETYPSMVLNTEVDETGFSAFTLVPVYIDDYIPRRAGGELGKYILNDLAKKSKDLDTWLKINNDSVTASVIMDTTQMELFEVEYFAELPMQPVDTSWVSTPHKIEKSGSITSVNAIDPTGDYAFRLGRELIWWGNMEDEGCTLWDLNHEDETLCDSVSHLGERSLQQFRDEGNAYNLFTNFEERIVCPSDTMTYSLCGWIKTQNAKDATIEVQYFQSRPSGSAIGTENFGAVISDDTDWTFFHRELSIPAGTNYFDVRLKSTGPDEGNGLVWFDDVSLICWEPWGDHEVLEEITFPNDLYYVQVKSGKAIESVQITYTETTFDEITVGVSENRATENISAKTLRIYPNPFNPASGTAHINFESARQGRALLSVYDYSGKIILLQHCDVEKGLNTYQWNGNHASGSIADPGMYIIHLQVGKNSFSEKCFILKN